MIPQWFKTTNLFNRFIMSTQKGKITSRTMPPQQGGFRYVVTIEDGTEVVCFLSMVQIQTLTACGEAAPKIGNEVYVEPSDVLGRDGTVYGNLSL